MNLGRLIARTVIGGLFVGHGTQKLFGWFDGPGLRGVSQMMEGLELRPGRRHALAVGLSETVGGALLALGAATPLAGAVLNGGMFTAINKVHFQKGLWNTGGGYEYNLVLIAAITALVEEPGKPSVDRALEMRTAGTGWALAALAAGAAGSAAVIEMARRAEPEPDPRRRFAREPEEAPAAEEASAEITA